MTECPHCGQPVFDDVERFSRELTPMQRLIFERVVRAGKHGIESQRLFDYLYAHRPDGGPEAQTVAALICLLNRRLRHLGKRIRAGQGARPAIYRLEDIPA